MNCIRKLTEGYVTVFKNSNLNKIASYLSKDLALTNADVKALSIPKKRSKL